MKSAIVSLSDKSNLFTLVNHLVSHNYKIISSGGTYSAINEILNNAYQHLYSVDEITNHPEILGGRVKTLHPIIHGGILASSENPAHITELQNLNIDKIDLVAVNLYPFEKTISKSDTTENDAIENIDIGGHTLLRAACKNYKDIVVLCEPLDYNILDETTITQDIKKSLSIKAWKHITHYDQVITEYFTFGNTRYRTYEFQHQLKYGCNPHQFSAAIYSINNTQISNNHLNEQHNMPFNVLNGNLGYINVLDAVNAWGLVCDLGQTLKTDVAASFKHTSPAGVGIGYLYDETNMDTTKPLSELEPINPLSQDIQYFLQKKCQNRKLSSVAVSYIRARSGDPMSSFGDFIGVYGCVNKELAEIIKLEVSDGIIAMAYEEEALEILKNKKNGKFIILEGINNNSYINAQQLAQSQSHTKPISCISEFREIGGLCITQNSNNIVFNEKEHITKNIPTKNKTLSQLDKVNLLIANTTLKYTQSNSVAYARDCQIIGVGAGQQSRVDCVKLAGAKARKWWLRNHIKVTELLSMFKKGVKRQEKINAVIRYIEGDFTMIEKDHWLTLFEKAPPTFTELDKHKYLMEINGVAMASDAFFPFRDNIDHASKYGVSCIVQPGGSVADEKVIEACDEYGMVMSMSGFRVFTH